MSLAFAVLEEKSRLKSLLDHFARIDDLREAWRVAHPLAEVLLLVVCATIADCDDYEAIAAWGATHLEFLRRYRPSHHGVPGGRWLTQLMNRINPALFSAAFSAWVRETWPDRPGLIAIDGKTSRRSHDRGEGKGPLHLVSVFAATSRLVFGQEAVEDKANELQAIPAPTTAIRPTSAMTAPVDRDALADEVARVIGDKIDHQICDLRRLREAAVRGCGGAFGAQRRLVVALRPHLDHAQHRRVGRAGTDGVDAQALARDFERGAANGRAGLSRDHVRAHILEAEEDAAHADRHHLAEHLGRRIGQTAVPRLASPQC